MTTPPITCAACDDTDGPFKTIDGTHLCESCLAITDGAK